MFIHIWMHWFWITAAYFKGFLLLLIISLSCISGPHFAEAGLLDNDTLTPHLPNRNDSSQPPNITSPTLLPPDPTTDPPATTPDPDPPLNIPDLPDTHNGSPLDTLQFPLKKFTKLSHPKYAKTRAKGKPANDTEPETFKLVEEKLDVNISIADDGAGRSGPEVDKRNDSLSDGGTSEAPSTDAPDSITTVAADGTSEAAVSESSENGTKAREIAEEVLKNETLVIESKVEESGSYTTVEPFLVKNRVAAATSAHINEAEPSEMNAGSITGITLGILVVFSLFGAVSFVLYRRRYLNKPEVLHDKCSNLDSSGYIDETSLRENSEEMYSLDNDSFLNSLEAMTIQNYWTESVKHTKL